MHTEVAPRWSDPPYAREPFWEIDQLVKGLRLLQCPTSIQNVPMAEGNGQVDGSSATLNSIPTLSTANTGCVTVTISAAWLNIISTKNCIMLQSGIAGMVQTTLNLI